MNDRLALREAERRGYHSIDDPVPEEIRMTNPWTEPTSDDDLAQRIENAASRASYGRSPQTPDEWERLMFDLLHAAKRLREESR